MFTRIGYNCQWADSRAAGERCLVLRAGSRYKDGFGPRASTREQEPIQRDGETRQVIGSLLTTRRLVLRPLDPDDARVLLAYAVENRAWLAPWEPAHPASYFTLEGQRNILYQCLEDRRGETGVLYGLFERAGGEGKLRGRISVSGIVRGIWQNGFVGYSIAQEKAGQGYMTEAVRRMVLHGFAELGLHRLQASIIPRNAASLRVAEKARFRYEGRALRYLRINEVWEDHDIYAITADELRPGYPE
jgi:ribosomal-protein-alanine N-acetyltransferase